MALKIYTQDVSYKIVRRIVVDQLTKTIERNHGYSLSCWWMKWLIMNKKVQYFHTTNSGVAWVSNIVPENAYFLDFIPGDSRE